MAEMAPKPAIDFSNMDYHRDENQWRKYARSKAGNVLHACEFARHVKKEGIVSVVIHLSFSRFDDDIISYSDDILAEFESRNA